MLRLWKDAWILDIARHLDINRRINHRRCSRAVGQTGQQGILADVARIGRTRMPQILFVLQKLSTCLDSSKSIELGIFGLGLKERVVLKHCQTRRGRNDPLKLGNGSAAL